MTSDNSNREFFKRQHYGRQSLDNAKINTEQKRRLRKCETASKSEENLSGNNQKTEETNDNIKRLSQLSNSFEHFDNLNNRLPQTCDRYSRKKSESCDNINRDRTSVKVVSYPRPPPDSESESAASNYHSYIPVAVDITTERPTPFIQRTALTMEPVPQQFHSHSDKASRAFTSVNLFLRPPSSEPQSPIDIVMQGSSITYSTFSTDPKLGYESQLEINFRSAGQSSVMASRLKPLSLSNENPNPSTQLVIRQQIKQKQDLEEAIQLGELRLHQIDLEIHRMMQYLYSRQSTPRKLLQIKEDIVFLRGECAKLTTSVDLASNEQVPLGETNEDFYKDIYHESDTSLVWRNQGLSGQSQSTEEVGWACHMCTFINYPVLPKCEQCEMPRLDFETSIPAPTSSRPRSSHATHIKSTPMSSKCTLKGSFYN